MATSTDGRRIRACVFDAYGTVLDVHSAIRRQGFALGSSADRVSQTWRTKQLEYAWVRSLAGRHADFWSCTTDALEYSLRLHGADPGLRDDLLEAYRTLDAFADVAPTLERLRGEDVKVAILSNGSPRMLDDALRSAGLTDFLQNCISIEDAGIYKPAPAAYRLAVERLALGADAIGFLSSNAWDIMGARSFGFTPVWVNRAQMPDEYGVSATVHQTRSLTDAVAHLCNIR